MRLPGHIGYAIISAILLATPVQAADKQEDMMASILRAAGRHGLTGDDLVKAIKDADAHPLGSYKNPVRVSSPAGERAYLSRLMCADGRHAGFERGGSTGMGPFGTILDVYAVDCADTPTARVYMDMYHSDYVETRAVPGFTIKP